MKKSQLPVFPRNRAALHVLPRSHLLGKLYSNMVHPLFGLLWDKELVPLHKTTIGLNTLLCPANFSFISQIFSVKKAVFWIALWCKVLISLCTATSSHTAGMSCGLCLHGWRWPTTTISMSESLKKMFITNSFLFRTCLRNVPVTSAHISLTVLPYLSHSATARRTKDWKM